MIINLQKLLRLPVYTESGTKLGRIFDLELEVESHGVARYLVKPSFFSARNFLIQVSQIKEITSDRVVVFDGAIQADLAKVARPTLLSEE